MADRRQSQRAWIRLPSGGHLDLAVKLSRTMRWGGESSWPLPLSVAQHSLTVLALRRLTAQPSMKPQAQLQELLHDAEEAFLGVDCISPLKGVLGRPFQAVSKRLVDAVGVRYGLPKWTDSEHAAHKHADLVAAASEAVHCVGWRPTEIRDVLGIQHPVLDTDPLATIYDCQPWKPWPSGVACQRFLDELNAIRGTNLANALNSEE
jgi:hypothetical protein